MANVELPKRQQDVLDAIRFMTQAKGYPPSIRELATLLGVVNAMTIKQHIDALQKKGFVTWEPGKNRTIRCVKQARKG